MIWKQVVKYVPVNVAALVISFGTIAILTRILSGAEFGRYALAIATMHFMHMATFTWVEAAMARFYARAEREEDMASHLKTLYISGIIMSALGLGGFMALVFALPLEPLMKTLIGFALTSTCFTLIYNLGMEAHRAGHRIGRYSAIHSSQSLIGFVIGISLIMLTPLREQAPFIGIIIANIVALAIDLPFMLKRMKGGKVESARTKTYFLYGLPISISLMLAYMLSQGDLFIIKYIFRQTPEAADILVGQYNAGYNLANRTLDMVFIWVGMAVTPIIVTALEQEGAEKAKAIMKNYGATLLLLVMPASIGIALVAEPAGFILGESVRAEAVKIMPWIAIAGLMNGLISYYVQRAFMLSKNTGVLAMTLVPPVIVNISLNFILIPKYGIMGAVWATLAAYSIGLVLSFIVARRYFPLPVPVKAFLQTSFACAVMAGIVLALPIPENTPDIIELIVKGSVGGAVYVLVAFATNTANCRDLVKDLLGKLKARKADKLAEA
ncbi:MAG: polysaccharide biosynthesis C-terminal domain-containing protein [Robiginitomaculum sp.]